MDKNILYLHRTQGRGAEGAHIRGMVDGFRAIGYHVDILGPPGIDPYVKTQSRTKRKDIGIQIFWDKLAAATPQIIFELMELVYNIYAFPAVWKKLKHKNYDFIYERYALNTFYGALLAEKYNIPYVVEVNDATVIERSRPLVLKRLAARIEKKVLQRARLVITISQVFKDLLLRKHNIPADKVLVLPNAVNPEDYILDPAKRIDRKSLNIDSEQIVIGCAGAFVPWHGLEFMIEALHDLIRSKNLFVLLIGDGPVRKDVEALAEKYGISSNVHFTGFLDASEVPYYLDLVDICIIPDSNDHGSPMKLFEFMAMAKPTILPDYKPLIEVVTHNKEGVLFDKRNALSLLSQVELLVKDKKRINLLGKRAQNKLLFTHTWIFNVNKVIQHLNKTIDRC